MLNHLTIVRDDVVYGVIFVMQTNESGEPININKKLINYSAILVYAGMFIFFLVSGLFWLGFTDCFIAAPKIMIWRASYSCF